VARHIFQACPVWIYTQSNITQASYSPEYITPTQQISRLERAEISFDAKHPTVIPTKHHIVGPLIRHYHEREGHAGTRAVLAAIQQDLWILQGRSRIRYIIGQCKICRKGLVIIYTQGWGRREIILTAKNSPTQPNLNQKFGLPHHF
jgi:hypothetical protein